MDASGFNDYIFDLSLPYINLNGEDIGESLKLLGKTDELFLRAVNVGQITDLYCCEK